MSEEQVMRPDGPTAKLVRAKIVEIGMIDWRAQTLIMGLAHEIDQLRELVESEAQDLDRHINANWRHRSHTGGMSLSGGLRPS